MTMEVNRQQFGLEEYHTGLELHESEQKMKEFKFLAELSL